MTAAVRLRKTRDLHRRLNRFERLTCTVRTYALRPVFPLFCGGPGRNSWVVDDLLHPKPLVIRKITISMSTPEHDSVSEDGHLHVAAEPSPEANDLIKAVDEMLDTMTSKFNKISTEVFAKMDEMAQRIDDLEAAIKAGSDQATNDGVGS